MLYNEQSLEVITEEEERQTNKYSTLGTRSCRDPRITYVIILGS